jgi:LPS-assembly protein
MTGFPRPERRQWTARRATLLLVGAMLALLCAAKGARAIDSSMMSQKTDKSAPIVFQADQVDYDDKLALTIARGHVEISQSGQVLLADTVTYNQKTDTVTASGNVSLILPTGEVIFSNFMELRNSMNDAFADNVRMLMADRSRLAANAARRINGNRLELARGVYSPCDLCKKDPTAPPAWQLKAREINDDKALKLIEFRDTVMEIDGVPVFYTPYMSQPEPSVKRANGFLTPNFGNSNTLGFHFSLPYFIVLDDDKDLTLDPRFTSRAGPLLATEYRERFGNGQIDAIGSVNYSNVGSNGVETIDSQTRGHVNANGIFDIDDTYRTGFQIQRASDQTYLLRFGFGNPLLNALISRAYLEGFEPRAATDVNAYIFQPLTPGLGDSTQPIVLPVVNRDWQSEPGAIEGGTLKANANILNIVREVGTQTRRLSLGGEWDRTFRDGIGSEYKFSASVRGDAYSISNLSSLSNPELPTGFFPVKGAPPTEPTSLDFLAARAFPQLGLTWNYPLVHRGDEWTEIIEPITGFYAGPSGGNRRNIPDEDSLGYEFKDSDLFRADRLAGYDVLDTGQRVDYGLKGGLYDKDGGNYRFLIGQSYRAENNVFLPPSSGAEQHLSDVVGRITLQPSPYLDLIYRFRFAKSDLSNRTQEVGVSVGPQSLKIGANYLLIPAEPQSDVVTVPATGQVVFGKREQLSVSATAKLTRYWSLTGSETINLTNSTNLINGIATPQSSNTSIYAQLAAVYQDECMGFVGSITQSGIRSGDVTPGISVMFSIVFKNLGEFGGNVASISGS